MRVHALKELENENLPDNCELIDAGTAGIDIIPLLEGTDKLVIIDAVQGGKKPGTLYRFSPDDITKPDNKKALSLHQAGVLETLSLAKKLMILPKFITIIGIEPKDLDWGLDMTRDVKERVPDIVKAVIREIGIPEPHC